MERNALIIKQKHRQYTRKTTRPYRTKKDIQHDIETQTKICAICLVRKEFSEFNKRNKLSLDGKLSYCSLCGKKKIKPEDSRKSYIKQTYGISLEEYDEMSKKQNGLCYICDQPETSKLNGKIKNLAIDHNHSTGKIRKLLCDSCNKGIGHLKENVNIVQRVIKYLEEFN